MQICSRKIPFFFGEFFLFHFLFDFQFQWKTLSLFFEKCFLFDYGNKREIEMNFKML